MGRPLVVSVALALALVPIAGEPLAKETKSYCHDPEVNRQWQEARETYPKDAMVLYLATERDRLCGLLADGTIRLTEAQTLWQAALTNSLLERARDEQRKRGLLRLFATF